MFSQSHECVGASWAQLGCGCEGRKSYTAPYTALGQASDLFAACAFPTAQGHAEEQAGNKNRSQEHYYGDPTAMLAASCWFLSMS